MAIYTHEMPTILHSGFEGQPYSSLEPFYCEKRGQLLFKSKVHSLPLDLSHVSGGELDISSVKNLEDYIGFLIEKEKLFDKLAKEMGPERDRLLRNIVEETMMNREQISVQKSEISRLEAQHKEVTDENRKIVDVLIKEREEMKEKIKENAELVKTSNSNHRRAKWYRNQLVKKNRKILKTLFTSLEITTPAHIFPIWKRQSI